MADNLTRQQRRALKRGTATDSSYANLVSFAKLEGGSGGTIQMPADRALDQASKEHSETFIEVAHEIVKSVLDKSPRIIQVDEDQIEAVVKVIQEEDLSGNGNASVQTDIKNLELPFDAIIIECMSDPTHQVSLAAIRNDHTGNLDAVLHIKIPGVCNGPSAIWNSYQAGFATTQAGSVLWETMYRFLMGTCRLLEASNVDLQQAEPKNVQELREQEQGVVRNEIVVRQTKRYNSVSQDGASAHYSHRFERRGNFAHHYELTAEGTPNRIFAKWSLERPEKVVMHNGEPCIKIWRAPSVVGPSDKPFIPKIRRIAS